MVCDDVHTGAIHGRKDRRIRECTMDDGVVGVCHVPLGE